MDLNAFIKGIDLRNVKDENNASLREVSSRMSNLEWLKLDDDTLTSVPRELSQLDNLKLISLSRNNINVLDLTALKNPGSLVKLNAARNGTRTLRMSKSLDNLRVLNLSRNQLQGLNALPRMPYLMMLDLSHNHLSELPEDFVQLFPALEILNVSHNSISELPQSMRRSRLKKLNLSNNPLSQKAVDLLCAILSLWDLDISYCTNGSLWIPTMLSQLSDLTRLNLSGLNLDRVPTCISQMKSLQVLNLSDNRIWDLSAFNSVSSLFPDNLKRLYLSGNQLSSASLRPLSNLKQLIELDLDNNRIEKLPIGWARLTQLITLSIRENPLPEIPRRLLLAWTCMQRLLCDNPSNILQIWPNRRILWNGTDFEAEVSLFPMNVYALQLILGYRRSAKQPLQQPTTQDVNNNIGEQHETPPIQQHRRRISLHHQRSLVDIEGTVEERRLETEENAKAQLQRNEFRDKYQDGFYRKLETVVESSFLYQEPTYNISHSQEQDFRHLTMKPLMIPQDFSGIFPSDTGQQEGLRVFLIEELKPISIEVDSPTLVDTDCYIFLNTYTEASSRLCHEIFFWLGSRAAIDKQACAAVHAVYLRDFLGRMVKVHRVPEGEEDEKFLELFPSGFDIMEGAHISTALKSVHDNLDVDIERVRVFRVASQRSLALFPPNVDLITQMSGPFIILDKNCAYVYPTSELNPILSSQASILASTMSRSVQHVASLNFIAHLLQEEYDEADLRYSSELKLFRIVMEKNSLELPQIKCGKSGRFDYAKLSSDEAYILDTGLEVFVWIGRKCPSILRRASPALGERIFEMLTRPVWSYLSVTEQGREPVWFTSCFEAPPLLQEKKLHIPISVDMSALTNDSSSAQDLKSRIMKQANRLKGLTVFSKTSSGFSQLEQEEYGIFHSDRCYVILCVYDAALNEANDDNSECIVYFWEGVHCSSAEWAKFRFEFEPILRDLVKSIHGCPIETIRIRENQEPILLSVHFGFHILTLPRSQIADASKRFFVIKREQDLIERAFEVKENQLFASDHDSVYIIDEKQESCMLVMGKSADVPSQDLVVALQSLGAYMLEVINEHHGRISSYRNWFRLEAASIMYKFETRASKHEMQVIVVPVHHFSQVDLNQDSVFLIISEKTVFVWTGLDTSETIFRIAIKSAEKYLSDIIQLPIIHVKQHEEPAEFRELFTSWDASKADQYHRIQNYERSRLRKFISSDSGGVYQK